MADERVEGLRDFSKWLWFQVQESDIFRVCPWCAAVVPDLSVSHHAEWHVSHLAAHTEGQEREP